jgi:hypothetical protein
VKAWKVQEKDGEVAVIVFTDTASRAKGIARCSSWFDFAEWCDIRATRLPEADHLAKEPGNSLMDGSTPEEQRFMRSIGWHEVDGAWEECARCKLHEWQDLPESRLTEVAGELVCAQCLEKEDQS